MSIEKGATLPPLVKGPLMTSHVVRWCAAQQNWDKIHYDQAYAKEVAGLSAPIINGALKQHLIVQFLGEAFKTAWVWRLDYRFAGMDLVGHSLEVHGTISAVARNPDHTLIFVDVAIRNRDLGLDTTTGTAILVYREDRNLRFAGPSPVKLPAELKVDARIGAPDPATPAHVRAKLGARLEYVESDYAIDLSRLRLFADAVAGLHPVHYDPACPEAKQAGGVLAPPLFPLHGLEATPGTHPLSADPRSMGREGVNEVGRDMARHFGIEISWNGGNKVEVHSLAAAGERVCAGSTLAGAVYRVGRLGGPMLIFETLNRYGTANGRALLTERQTMICRINDARGGA